ncbi:MAG: ribosomal-processing cysteine protease Prp [Chloroflexi bacterium]|nr:ribosomal-processing cysteine protease Prp [Chloroflexota bacterium]
MLNLRLRSNARRRLLSIEARGHLGTAPHGKDLACAAASVLIQNAALSLEKLNCISSLDIRPGNIKLKLKRKLTPEQEISAIPILKSLFYGLENLRESYPDRLKYKFDGRRPLL